MGFVVDKDFVGLYFEICGRFNWEFMGDNVGDKIIFDVTLIPNVGVRLWNKLIVELDCLWVEKKDSNKMFCEDILKYVHSYLQSRQLFCVCKDWKNILCDEIVRIRVIGEKFFEVSEKYSKAVYYYSWTLTNTERRGLGRNVLGIEEIEFWRNVESQSYYNCVGVVKILHCDDFDDVWFEKINRLELQECNIPCNFGEDCFYDASSVKLTLINCQSMSGETNLWLPDFEKFKEVVFYNCCIEALYSDVVDMTRMKFFKCTAINPYYEGLTDELTFDDESVLFKQEYSLVVENLGLSAINPYYEGLTNESMLFKQKYSIVDVGV